MQYTVSAVKDGKTIESVKSSPRTAIAKAHLLLGEGWSVHILDEQGRTFAPAAFNGLLTPARPG